MKMKTQQNRQEAKALGAIKKEYENGYAPMLMEDAGNLFATCLSGNVYLVTKQGWKLILDIKKYNKQEKLKKRAKND